MDYILLAKLAPALRAIKAALLTLPVESRRALADWLRNELLPEEKNGREDDS